MYFPNCPQFAHVLNFVSSCSHKVSGCVMVEFIWIIYGDPEFFWNLSNCVEICAPIKCPIVFQLNSAELCSSRSNLANFLSIFTNGWFYMKEGRWWQYCYNFNCLMFLWPNSIDVEFWEYLQLARNCDSNDAHENNKDQNNDENSQYTNIFKSLSIGTVGWT